jgi:hypothetical protein
VTVARSIAIVSQLRHPSRSARAVDARAAASQPTEPASARAVLGIPSRPPPEPPHEQQLALSMHSGGSCASCRRPSRRRPRQPQPWSCPRPPLCLRQGPVCPPKENCDCSFFCVSELCYRKHTAPTRGRAPHGGSEGEEDRADIFSAALFRFRGGLGQFPRCSAADRAIKWKVNSEHVR